MSIYDAGTFDLHDWRGHRKTGKQSASSMRRSALSHIGRKPAIPTWLQERSDVRVIQLEGRGLSRNRNYALAHASGDILKICDDDEVWEQAYFDTILETYRLHPDYDIVHFQAIGPRKNYPPHFVSSFEMTMRRSSLGDLRSALASARLSSVPARRKSFFAMPARQNFPFITNPFPFVGRIQRRRGRIGSRL